MNTSKPQFRLVDNPKHGDTIFASVLFLVLWLFGSIGNIGNHFQTIKKYEPFHATIIITRRACAQQVSWARYLSFAWPLDIFHEKRRRMQDCVDLEACQSFSFPAMCNEPFLPRADYILTGRFCKVP